MTKRTKIPRVSIQVGILDDEDFITLTGQPDGYQHVGLFASMLAVVRDSERNPVPMAVLERRLGRNQNEIKATIKAIADAARENGNQPWLIEDGNAVLVRSFATWNKVETRGGKRQGAGRKPKETQDEIKKESKGGVSVSVPDPVTGTDTGEEQIAPSDGVASEQELTDFVFEIKGGTWTLPVALYEKLSKAHGRIDEQLNKAAAWCVANPQKRKTATGMARFLNGWLARNPKSGGRTIEDVKRDAEDATKRLGL